MPSDPQGRLPSGVLVRPGPDWFDDQMASGGWFLATPNTPGSFTYARAGLFNNSIDGSAFKVYGITAQDNAGGGVYGYGIQGAPAGTLIGPASPTRFDLGQPYGLIYQQIVVLPGSPPSPFAKPTAAVTLGSSGFDGMTYLSPFPLFIVPVGWTLWIEQTQHDSGQYGAGFFYQLSHE